MTQEFRNSVGITIHSEIEQNGERDLSTEEVRGEWIRRGDTYFLRYTEPSSSATTLIKWTKDKQEVFVTRQGPVEVRQHFLPKEEIYAVYSTPYGRFNLRTVTEELMIAVGEDHGFIQLNFSSQLNESTPAEHKMTIIYRMLS